MTDSAMMVDNDQDDRIELGDRVFCPNGYGLVQWTDGTTAGVSPIRPGTHAVSSHDVDNVEPVCDEEWPVYDKSASIANSIIWGDDQ